MLIILAFLCFLAAGVIAAIGRAWAILLIAAGLALWVVDAAGPINIG
jgi:hypothetical protein